MTEEEEMRRRDYARIVQRGDAPAAPAARARAARQRCAAARRPFSALAPDDETPVHF
jgi:hypothetical protein